MDGQTDTGRQKAGDQMHRQGGGQTDSQMYSQTYGCLDKQTDRPTGTQAGGQSDRHRDDQTDKQVNMRRGIVAFQPVTVGKGQRLGGLVQHMTLIPIPCPFRDGERGDSV